MNMIDCATQLKQTDCQTLFQNGVTHVGRYLPTSSWKGLTQVEVEVIKESGLQLISVYESGATKATYFNKTQGVNDANHAYQLAQSLGQPEGTTIYFAVDYDAQTKDFAGILNYFQGLKDTLTSYKIGAYGKFEVMVLLQTKGLANKFWQTYAWSSGQHAKNLHLFQYKNDIQKYNLSLDLDNVENEDCGAWWYTPKVQAVVKPTSSIIATVEVIADSTDIRQNPDHASGFIRNAVKGEKFNVVSHVDDHWHQILLDNQGNKGWLDGNAGKNIRSLKVATMSMATQKYTVKQGDTLSKLAPIFKTSIENLMTLNQLNNPNKINVGQTLIVPKI